MAFIKPFKALRFNEFKAGALCELVCPPYDIVSNEQREQLVSKNKFKIYKSTDAGENFVFVDEFEFATDSHPDHSDICFFGKNIDFYQNGI